MKNWIEFCNGKLKKIIENLLEKWEKLENLLENSIKSLKIIGKLNKKIGK